MSLTKMAPGAWRYYAEEIASGREDYYAEAHQRGRWLGSGAKLLGLEGRDVAPEELERLFGRGFSPIEGRSLGAGFDPDNPRTVAGFALTFSPPKSVSVLWATGASEVASSVQDAQAAAVESALGFLERHAAFTRRGRGGVFQVDTDGLIVASFTHRTSRAGDPQLHTHALVANKVRALDGSWLSVDARELYAHQKAASMLYRAALRAELSARLGVAWGTVDDNGFAEIAGVPERLITEWSSRRHDLERVGLDLVAEREAGLGRSLNADERAACFQIAAYRTRAPKLTGAESTAELMARWRSEAEEIGEPAEQWLDGVLDRGHPTGAPPREPALVAEAVRRLHDTSATWTRANVVEVCSTLVTGSSAEAVAERIEALADRVLASPEVVSLRAPLPADPPAGLRRRDGFAVVERHGGLRYATKTTLRHEAFALAIGEAGHDKGVAQLDARRVDARLARSGLGTDQREAVRTLLTGGDELACVVGPAGAGKSRLLDAARATWEEEGYAVRGLAPSARAAAVLAEESQLRAETLALFLTRAENGIGERLTDRHVVIVDEAAMARTDDLTKLIVATHEAGAKLVLVGDPAQLGAVGPGGLFATLVEDERRAGHLAELETVRRFTNGWERGASLYLRARDPKILSVYEEQGRIEGGTREEMLDRAFALWRTARDEGQAVVVTAGDNETVDELSRRCRADRVLRGEVTREGVVTERATIGVGDEIVTLKNDRQLRTVAGDFVRNGERWQVLGLHDGALRVASLDGHGSTTLPAAYVREEVALAYALTVHKAQGMTTDASVVVADGRMTGEQLYVAMSRGREENRALVITDTFEEEHGFHESREPLDVLRSVLQRQGADRSAHDVMRHELGRYENQVLRAEIAFEQRRRIAELAGPDHSDEIETLESDRTYHFARYNTQRAERQAQRIAWELARAQERLATLHAKAAAQPDMWTGQVNLAAKEVERREADVPVARAIAAERQAELLALERAARLPELRAEQAQRDAWLDEHPDEAEWLAEFDGVVSAREIADAIERGEDLSEEVPEHNEYLERVGGGPTREELGFDREDYGSHEWILHNHDGPELGMGGPGLGL